MSSAVEAVKVALQKNTSEGSPTYLTDEFAEELARDAVAAHHRYLRENLSDEAVDAALAAFHIKHEGMRAAIIAALEQMERE